MQTMTRDWENDEQKSGENTNFDRKNINKNNKNKN
jgi:hypothetical protein